MADIFIQQKKELLKILENSSNKLLFPNTVINSLSLSGLNALSSFFKKYNSYIIKIRILKIKLMKLNSWDIFYNSHYLWNFSVLSNIKSVEKYIKEIFDYSFGKNVNIFRKMILTQSNVNPMNILIFMAIKKQNNKYVYGYNDKNTNETIFKELSLDNVKKLLPLCIKPINNVGDKTLLELYEKIHELDQSDIFDYSENII